MRLWGGGSEGQEKNWLAPSNIFLKEGGGGGGGGGAAILRSVRLLLLLLLLEIRNRIVPTGSTPEGGPTEVSPTTQATRHPRALFTSLFPLPPYYCHASCIRSVPPLYIYPTKSLACFFLVFLSYTYIQPHKKENPSTNLKPHTQTVLIYYINNRTINSKAPLRLSSCVLRAYLFRCLSLTPSTLFPFTV